MALRVYGVDETVVLSYLPHAYVVGDTSPGLASISSGGEFLSRAAAEACDALRKGGFGAPEATSDTNPEAYWIIHCAIAERAAIYYAASVGQPLLTTGTLDSAWKRNEGVLMGWQASPILGELEVSDNADELEFYSGDEDEDDLDVGRFTYDMDL